MNQYNILVDPILPRKIINWQNRSSSIFDLERPRRSDLRLLGPLKSTSVQTSKNASMYDLLTKNSNNGVASAYGLEAGFIWLKPKPR